MLDEEPVDFIQASAFPVRVIADRAQASPTGGFLRCCPASRRQAWPPPGKPWRRALVIDGDTATVASCERHLPCPTLSAVA